MMRPTLSDFREIDRAVSDRENSPLYQMLKPYIKPWAVYNPDAMQIALKVEFGDNMQRNIDFLKILDLAIDMAAAKEDNKVLLQLKKKKEKFKDLLEG
jgi:hypothetical protein